MPVHKPGPRLGRSVPFKYLANKGAHGGKKDPNGAQLNLTPMVDMMTMLVVFLLSTFSATGEIMMVQRGLKLPSAVVQADLKKAPLLIVSMNSITLNGEEVASTTAIADNPQTDLTALREKLKAMYQEEEANFQPNSDDQVFPARVILQADRAAPSQVINQITLILYTTGWRNISFAVEQKAGK